MENSVNLTIIKHRPGKEVRKILYIIILVGIPILISLSIPSEYRSNLYIGFCGIFIIVSYMIFNYSYKTYSKTGELILSKDEIILRLYGEKEEVINICMIESINVHYSNIAGDSRLFSPLVASAYTEEGINNTIEIQTKSSFFKYNILLKERYEHLQLKKYVDYIRQYKPKAKVKYDEDFF